MTLRWTGRCSSFGGPDDLGMVQDTGLTCYEGWEANREPSLFVPGPSTVPTWRRLIPSSFYIALMFVGPATGGFRASLQRSRWRVTGGRTGKAAIGRLVDRGPHPDTGRLVDCSPGLLEAIGCHTDDVVTVEAVEAGGLEGFRLDGRVRTVGA